MRSSARRPAQNSRWARWLARAGLVAKGQERRWYTALGVVGHLARSVIFGLAGVFLVRAAWQYDPKEAIGLDGALRKLAHADYGQVLLSCTVAGLLAYALFCLVQARYREV